MASIGTVTVSASISASAVAGGAVSLTGASKIFYPQTIIEMMSATQIIGNAADEAIVINDVTSPPGYIMIRNLDTTNYIELGTATGGSFAASKYAKIYPGGYYLASPLGTIYAKAAAGTPEIQVCAVDGALALTAP